MGPSADLAGEPRGVRALDEVWVFRDLPRQKVGSMGDEAVVSL